MVYKIVILCASVFLASKYVIAASTDDFDATKSTLQLIAIVHRHGLRTPEKTWPSDPYSNQKKYWPIGWGQLLPKGKQQLYQLGKTFQSRYKKFVPKYDPTSVRVNSSDYDRCHMSVAALTAGWFPPIGSQRWSSKLLWQPIPIHSVPTTSDRVIALKIPCPKCKHELQKIHDEIKMNETDEDQSLYKYFTEHMGEPIESVKQLETYYSTFVIEDRVGYELPSWSNAVYPDKVLQKARLSFEAHTWTPFLQRLFGGPMIKEILNQFKLKSEGSNKLNKVFIYSAHDITIFNILRTLHFQNIEWPDFGSALVFELHKLFDNKYYVKLLYFKNSSTKKPRELKIPECEKPCLLTKLHRLTEYVRGVDFDTDCLVRP